MHTPMIWLLVVLLVSALIIREWYFSTQKIRYAERHHRIQELETALEHSQKEVVYLRTTNDYVQNMLKDNASLLVNSRKDMDTHFNALCSQIIMSNQKSFLDTLNPVLEKFQTHNTHQMQSQSPHMKTLVQPLADQMNTMQKHINAMEKERVGAYEGLREQVINLAQGQKILHTETQTLSAALRTPHVRGCWGEMQLRRVVELAGMMAYCDFCEQPPLTDQKNRTIKPDMIVRIPGNKHIIVDAKAPLLHYLDATSCTHKDDYAKKIKEHAKSLANHIRLLSDKKYWSCQTNAVELTVLFLPGEAFLSAALESQASLIETAAQRNVILATPTVLIALLKTIAQGWRQDVLSKQTQHILDIARDMWEQMAKFQKSMDTLGKSLTKSTTAYKDAMHIMDNAIAPAAEKLGSSTVCDLVSPADTLTAPEPSDITTA